jgi:hypothetical protein
MAGLDHLISWLDLDPFQYLVVTMLSIIVWTWCSVIGDFALTGRGIWYRWGSLAIAGISAGLFAYTARLLT